VDTTAKAFAGNTAQDNLAGAAAQAAGLALLNAVNAQQQGYVTAAATVTMTVARILAGQTVPEEAAATAAKLAPPAPVSPNAVSSEAGFAMIEQAWAIAVQDAAAYLRNIEIIASAAIGVALGTAAHGGGGDASQAIAAAHSCVGAAVRSLDEICAGAAKTAKDFPRAP